MKFRLIESELNEVYPNKGESKKDFIARFMSATKDEYPDVKQRHAVANSYWSRRNKKRTNESQEDYITLYHNTPYKNVESILKNGLKIGSSRSEMPSGWQMTWATTKPQMKGEYGGNIIKFKLPKDKRFEKVNNTQYIIYDDIEPELIEGVDYMIGNSGNGYMHTSELQEYIDDFGKNLVKKVISKEHNSDIPLEKIKELTKELDW